MFISEAMAQTGSAAPAGFDFMAILPMVLIFAVFYFLVIRPQQKKVKAHKALVSGARRGDKVITASGIYGKITKVIDDTEVEVEIAENTRIRLLKSAIGEIISKTESAENKLEKSEPEDSKK